jgi:hypothetical protein
MYDPALQACSTVRTGQWVSRITYCALEPKTNFLAFDFFSTPIISNSLVPIETEYKGPVAQLLLLTLG